jgi:hypothetical protein
VKGKGAGFPSLVKEWLAGSLAKTFGLPIPGFAILNVPRNLYELGRRGLLADLGHGPVFGSKAIPNVNEITTTEATEIPVEMKRRIAVFDWWIMNGDRTLSESGGNPNILWDVSIRSPFLIDHNLAFDPSLTLVAMERTHIFGSLLSEIIDDPSLQKSWAAEFHRCLGQWNDFCDALPERWNYVDDQLTVPSGFASTAALTKLRRFDTPVMWTRP